MKAGAVAGRKYALRLGLFLLVFWGVIYGALAFSFNYQQSNAALQVGQVAAMDYTAPMELEYISQVRTEEARDAAAQAVKPVYGPPDPSIARQQIEHLRAALNYISLVRDDAYATDEQKRADLQGMDALTLSDDEAQALLDLSAQRWQVIQQEATSVLEQALRGSVREDDLAYVRQSIPSLVSLALPEDQVALVTALVRPFIVPNEFISPELTEQTRQAAREAVAPVTQHYVAGETVVQRGQVLTPADLEALQALGLTAPQRDAHDYWGALVLATALTVFAGLYMLRTRPDWLLDIRRMTAILFNLAFFAFSVRLVIPGHAVLPYFFPLPAFGLLLDALFGMPTALVFALPLAMTAAYALPGMMNLTAYYLFASLGGILALGRAHRLSAFWRAALVIAGMAVAMLLTYRLPFEMLDWSGLLLLVGAAAFNGLASAGLALLMQYFLAQGLDLITPIQLLEYMRPDAPLLRYLLQKAPGTYQHSLQVANLAEQAAEAIGADALLVRVGALYHDVGKAENAAFFIENQLGEQVDTHEEMDPYQAAETIIRHVSDGVMLARKHHLPSRIQDFIREHHGTMMTRYQYQLAVKAAGGESAVDERRFHYPGPPPRSRETALLMIADGVEARARARRPADEAALQKLVKETIDYVHAQGQLDNTPLTLRDLQQVRQTMVDVLRGTYHPRVNYPEPKTQESKRDLS